MRDFGRILRDAGRSLWLSAVAGLVGGLLEAAVLVFAVAAAVAMSRGAAPTVDLPFDLSTAAPGTLVIAGLTCAVLRTLCALAGLRLATNAKSALEARYQRALLGAYLVAPWEAVAGRPEGELQELTSTQTAVAAASVMHAAQALQAGLSFAALIASSVLISPATAAVSIGGAAALAVALRPIARLSSSRSSRRLRHDLDVAALTAETVRLAEEVAVFGVGPVQAARGGRIIEDKRRTGAAADFAAELTLTAYQGTVFVLVFVGLGVLVIADIAVGPALAAIIVLLLRAFAYSQQAQGSYAKALAAIPRRDAVLEATRVLAESRRPAGDQRLDDIATCELAGVGYSYPPGHQALTGVDLTVHRGDALGVTGPSGSGKSTLVQLLLRLRTPSEGTYTVNGRPADEYDADDWTAEVSLVPQDPKLIDGTIADNIRFLRDRITHEQIVRASRLAGLEADLAGFSDGLNRLVGPRDRALSGGQRQRLAIARALAGEPSLLVLDEPTSALDAECERIIQETLVSLKGKVTVVVITHEPTTLQQCDQIVVLRDGRIEARGAPSEVMERGSSPRLPLRASPPS